MEAGSNSEGFFFSSGTCFFSSSVEEEDDGDRFLGGRAGSCDFFGGGSTVLGGSAAWGVLGVLLLGFCAGVVVVVGDFRFLGEGGCRLDWGFLFAAAARAPDMSASKAEGGFLDMAQKGEKTREGEERGKVKREETLIGRER